MSELHRSWTPDEIDTIFCQLEVLCSHLDIDTTVAFNELRRRVSLDKEVIELGESEMERLSGQTDN